MNKTKYDLIVYIGRFQPFSEHHKEIIRRAKEQSDHILVIVGSAYTRRTTRNPLTFEERASMIQEFIDSEYKQPWKFDVVPQRDRTYNDTSWAVDVGQHVKRQVEYIKATRGDTAGLSGLADYKIGIIGHKKDETTTHLDMFPQYDLIDVGFIDAPSATEIRDKIFYAASVDKDFAIDRIKKDLHVPYNVAKTLAKMYKEELEYKQHWGEGPFLTADSLVQVGDHILLVERGDDGGLALPGGFLNKNETFLQGAIRELKEETRLKVPVPVLKGSIKKRQVFDDPHRSTRARIVTEAFHFHLINDTTLPEVRGSDDARRAFWFPINELCDKEELFFDDHYHIIKYMLNI